MENRLKLLRKAKYFTQASLAEAVNTTSPTVQRLESGQAQLTPKWAERFSSALGCHPAELFLDMKGLQQLDEKALKDAIIKWLVAFRDTGSVMADDQLANLIVKTYKADIAKGTRGQKQ